MSEHGIIHIKSQSVIDTRKKTIFKCLFQGECSKRNSKNHCGFSDFCDYKEPIDDLKIGGVYISSWYKAKVTLIKYTTSTHGIRVHFVGKGYQQQIWAYSKTEFLSEFTLENIGE